jgi:hypothetical protein
MISESVVRCSGVEGQHASCGHGGDDVVLQLGFMTQPGIVVYHLQRGDLDIDVYHIMAEPFGSTIRDTLCQSLG